ncbi:hypothetical protein ACHHYP_20622 [Achlya hypogyna]|uniref:Ankyrin repeat protein n=1 Tax=Achlya hypogyna TaxID=1202772 RepID=A0A1V9YGQ8_ACHHY|nr:hypothetical protein ACHHYP_20622 [Achlya hypogyna]
MSTAVLASPDLVTLITAFQDGIYACLRDLPTKSNARAAFLTRSDQPTPFYILHRFARCRPHEVSPRLLAAIALRGDVSSMRLLHDIFPEVPLRPRLAERIIRRGHHDMLRYLIEERSAACTDGAMIAAAHYGHLDILRYLHEQRLKPCSASAVAAAFRGGHMACVEYLWIQCPDNDFSEK